MPASLPGCSSLARSRSPSWRAPFLTADLRLLPPVTTIVATERDCGSGGCWINVEVRPADGRSEASLMEALGIDHDPYACERGGPPMFWTICHWRSDAVADLGRIVISLAYQRAQ